MTTKLKLILSLGLFLILSSCGIKEKKIQKEFDKVNEKSLNELALKYNAITNWDSTTEYSFVYEDMFIDGKRLMLFKGKIYDISRQDSNYVIKVFYNKDVYNIDGMQKKYIAYITFKSKYTAQFFKNYKSTSGAFIIQITKVISSIPRIVVDAEVDGYDANSYTYLSFDEDYMLTFFEGELIDYSLDIIDQSI